MQAPVKHWHDHSGAVLDTVNDFDVIDCAQCGFKHVIPVPTVEELEHIYRHEYYTEEKPLYIDNFKEDLPWWNLAYGDRYDSFEASLPPGRRNILDIGSGPGYFLKHGKDRGWNTTGIEPSTRAAAHSKSLGLHIIEEFLDEELAKTLGTFDVIHLSEVLEHIPEPKKLLEIAYSLLAPGGMLCVVVPNDYNPIQQALVQACGYAPWWVAPPHHLNYFDFDSLPPLLQQAGFTPLFSEATFPIDMFLLMGDNYIGNDTVGRACHAKRKQFDLNMAAAGLNDKKRAYFRALAQTGLGREICAYAHKPQS